MNTQTNVDPQELNKFDAIAARWWDPEGECKPLHRLNPIRLRFIEERIALSGKQVLDIGCGGGLLSEAMASCGAKVTGIDMAASPLAVAKLHLLESGWTVDYQQASAEQFAEQHQGEFDVITCMELLEHVPEPSSLIAACATMLKPDGELFFSTLNRNAKAFIQAIIGAEYLLKLLPKGTHRYDRFIRPSELARWCREANIELKTLKGMGYNPLTQQFKLTDNLSVNYLAHAQPIN
ncbi:MAG: bifunctional 2-polyprenyl-6-hydroxyphenol methylase/3-demethylubiquinol 3-O-methyltransferase UbiG [Gammaproteobacteria bacterium]|nr:bifunctional 2-polyprenyl-6-hydroxyphenol methylase/3-demethylubiquinol 3-O-methyltransferase UbiG [Gammaproteobacteria bacterium]